MLGGNVADELLNQYGLADTCTAEQANLTAAGVGCQQVDDLNTGLQNLYNRALLGKRRRIAMNRPGFRALDRFSVVNRVTQHVEHTAEHFLADRNFDRLAGRDDFHTATQTLTGREHDAAHGVAADMLCDLHDLTAAVQRHGQRFIDFRELAVIEHDVNDWAKHLDDDAFMLHKGIPSLSEMNDHGRTLPAASK